MSNREMIKEVIRFILKENKDNRALLLKEDKDVLRSFIRHCVYEKELKEKINKDKISLIREVTKRLIMEAEATGGSPASPTDLTSINFLKNLLKNIIPSIEEDYKELTTSKRQRASFRTHMLNAAENLLNSLDADPSVIDQEMQEVTVKVNDDKPEGFIDIYGDEKKPEDPDANLTDQEKFAKGLDIKRFDKTGRKAAFECFNKIKKQFENEYSKLDPDSQVEGRDQTEREIFKDYLLLNLKLYFDRFEEDISPDLSEPVTPSEDKYVKSNQNAPSEELVPPGA